MMSPMRILKPMLLSTLVCLLPQQTTLAASQMQSAALPDNPASTASCDAAPESIANPAAAEAIGGRGPQHCALALGVMLGGAIGFWANPLLGGTVLRFGLMATVLHC